MHCPNCGHDNIISGPFCEACGASLQSPDAAPDETSEPAPTPASSIPAYTDPSIYEYYAEPYQAPPPPPLNGHNKLLSSPSSEPLAVERESYARFGRQSQIFGAVRVHEERPPGMVSRVFKSMIYFTGVAFSGFWLLAALVEIGKNSELPLIGLAFWPVMIVGSIVVFVRFYRQRLRLSFPRFLLRFFIATVLTSIALFIEATAIPDLANSITGSFILAIILMAYFLVIAMFALW